VIAVYDAWSATVLTNLDPATEQHLMCESTIASIRKHAITTSATATTQIAADAANAYGAAALFERQYPTVRRTTASASDAELPLSRAVDTSSSNSQGSVTDLGRTATGIANIARATEQSADMLHHPDDPDIAMAMTDIAEDIAANAANAIAASSHELASSSDSVHFSGIFYCATRACHLHR
jgi:hypothetical protein